MSPGSDRSEKHTETQFIGLSSKINTGRGQLSNHVDAIKLIYIFIKHDPGLIVHSLSISDILNK